MRAHVHKSLCSGSRLGPPVAIGRPPARPVARKSRRFWLAFVVSVVVVVALSVTWPAVFVFAFIPWLVGTVAALHLIDSSDQRRLGRQHAAATLQWEHSVARMSALTPADRAWLRGHAWSPPV